jgi:phosphatidylinositol 3,5-bisphosphate 5-phosphatase
VDPTYAATQLHFADLLERYSSPIVVLNLVKQREKRERECIVGTDFQRSVEAINATMPMEQKIRYCALDFSAISKAKTGLNLLKALEEVCTSRLLGLVVSLPWRE